MVGTRKRRTHKVAAVETANAQVTSTHSVQVVQCLLQVSVQNIMYLRRLLPEEEFEEKSMPVLEGKARMLSKEGRSAEGSMVVDWVDRGIMDSVKKGFVKRAIFGVAADADGKELLEEYVFNFDYGDDGSVSVGMQGRGGNTAQSKSRAAAPTADGVAEQVKKLLRLLVVTCATLEPPPPERYLFMKLTYHEHTPESYEPPMFEPAGHRAVGCFSRRPFSLKVGTVDMKHHAVSIAVKSVLDTVQTVAGGPEADNTRLLDTTRASDSVGEVSDGPSSGAGGMADLFTEHDAMLAEHLAGDGAELGDEELQQVQEWVLRRPQVDFVDALQHFSSMPQDTLEAAFAELQRTGVLVERTRDAYTVPGHMPLSPMGHVDRAAAKLQKLAVAADAAGTSMLLPISQVGGVWAAGGSTCTQSVRCRAPAGKRGLEAVDSPRALAWPSSQGSDRDGATKKTSIVETVIHQQGKRARAGSRLGGMQAH